MYQEQAYYGNAPPQQQQHQEEQVDFRPPNLTPKQDQLMQLVSRYIAFSIDPSRFQHELKQKVQHNHNFRFLNETDSAYLYYSYLLHMYMEYARLGYTNESMGQQQQQQQGGQLRVSMDDDGAQRISFD